MSYQNIQVLFKQLRKKCIDFPGGSVVKNSPANAEDAGLLLGLGRSLREGNGNPRQYSCLENFMGRGAWQATVHEVTKIWKAMAPHSSTLAWKIPWMEEPGRLQSTGSLRVRHD